MNRRTGAIAAGIAVVVLALSDVVAGQLASRPAAEWMKTLENPERVAGLRIDEVIARLRLGPGDVVADLGAGSGLFAFPLAKAVASGRVYAVELDEGFLAHMRERAKAEGVSNVLPVLGRFTDPMLPARDVDVAFFHDVLHHVQDRPAYLKSVAGYVKPGGRIVVIDLDAETSPHRNQPELVVSKEQATALLAEVGFVVTEDVRLFPDKWFLVFTRKQ
jgi:ubiquinone/menaquinone biosynthesis C-methylase UbiE